MSHLQISFDKTRTYKPKSRPAPFSLRLTVEERATLDRAAAGMQLGAYIRQKLFNGDLTPRRTRGQNPVKDHAALGRVLGLLGRSHIAGNLNQLAKAANIGALPVSPDLEEDLLEALLHVRQIRDELMRALGFSVRETERTNLTSSQRAR